MDQALINALARVDAFIAAHPDYSRQDVTQPGQGSTNKVVFARRGSTPVVFKIFCDSERKERECFGLRHWRSTGLVPELIWDADLRMIVMGYVPGTYLSQARQSDGESLWPQACRATGFSIAKLALAPLSPKDRQLFEERFYAPDATFAAYVGRIVELGRAITAHDPDFSAPYWKENLDFIDVHIPRMLSEPVALYHQDVGNLHVQQGRFSGFFDLEMCRVGCATMQLGSALLMLQELECWQLFRQGWESATQVALSRQDCLAAAAANHLLVWRRISRWMSYDGTPGTGYDWASPAKPDEMRRWIEAVNQMLQIKVG